MNLTETRQTAEEFEAVAHQLIDAGHKEVGLLLHSLQNLIQRARNEQILAPLGWGEIPGHWHFTEGSLSRFPELESAYAKFKIQLTGGESPVLREIKCGRLEL